MITEISRVVVMIVEDVDIIIISMTRESAIFTETDTKETTSTATATTPLKNTEVVEVETASGTLILNQAMTLVMTQTKEADLIRTVDIDTSEVVEVEIFAVIEGVDSETEWVVTIINKTSMVNMVRTMAICANKKLLAGIEAEVGARSDMKHGY